MQVVGAAIGVVAGKELVVFEQVEDGNRALVLDLRLAPDHGLLIERHVDDAAVALRAHP
ncbi:hypothetical protein D3C71_2069880 [compost metagenome]